MIIVNNKHTGVVKQMEDSRFRFVLTGSRLFGGVTATSDWDYFVQDTPGVRTFLYELGFYEDDGFTGASKHYDDSTFVTLFCKDDMQVQLVKDCQLKERAQEFLMLYSNLKLVPKDARKPLWNFALSILRSHNLGIVEAVS